MGINSAWKSTCKVLLKEEIGDLKGYEYYLKKFMGPVSAKRKSVLSGKQVTTADDDFGLPTRFISNSEREQYAKLYSKPFDINRIKDIDSAIQELEERFIYSGDIVLGKSVAVENCQRCTDVSDTYWSQDVSDSRNIAYCSMLRYSTFVFGSDCTGEIDFVIKNFQGWKSRRLMETTNTQYCSDVYFSANMRYSAECMFCFNQEGKRNMIGNLQLGKDEYSKLKQKLVEDIRGELGSKKDIVSINELLGAPPRAGKCEKRPATWDVGGKKHFASDCPQELDKAFASACSVLFGRKLSGKMTDYEKWLMKNVRAPPKSKSKLSGKSLYILPILFNEPVRDTHISLEEARQASRLHISEEDAQKLCISNAKQILKPVALFTSDVKLGENVQVKDTVSFADSINIFGSSTMYGSKNCAYGCWVSHNAENMFGCDHTFYSKFCIHAYRSLKLVRCFEISDSKDCSDCFFCHNCENCHECMFCFNVKSKRYAIGNVEVGREKYSKIKKMLQQEIAKRLEEKKEIGIGIYNIGCQIKGKK